jgi:predicted ArsR family transcriptional regulator
MDPSFRIEGAVTDEFAERVAGIGALAEPARRTLYEYVVAQPAPVGREQAARGTGVPVHSAKFHLDRLVADGLLEVEYRRLTGRTGPGAGRPAKLYRRSGREVAVSLPERRYDLAGSILATGVERAAAGHGPVETAVREAAAERGRAVGAAGRSGAGPSGAAATGAGANEGSEAAAVAAVLAGHGFEPRSRDDELVLANCPFDALAREHTQLVCGMNEAFVGGVLDGLGCTALEACLDPEPGLCCVKARPRG